MTTPRFSPCPKTTLVLNWYEVLLTKFYPHFIVIGALFLAILTACGSDTPGSYEFQDTGPVLVAHSVADISIVTSGAPRLNRVRTIPNLVQLMPGETIALSALAFDQNGREIESASFTWQIVDARAGSVSTRGVFRAGFIKGFFEKAIVVNARVVSGKGTVNLQGTASVTIFDPQGKLQPTDVVVIPGSIEVTPGEVLALIALAIDAKRITVPQQQFRWEVLKPMVGSISQNGEFTAFGTPGEYLDAIRVSLKPESESGDSVETVLDVTILDSSQAVGRLSARVLPQFISVFPTEEFRFTAIVLDQQGNRLLTEDIRWEVLDDEAGSISQDGLFVAGRSVGTYPKVVQVTLTVPNFEKSLVASGTVSILDSSNLSVLPSRAPVFSIFPNLLILAPGETRRVSVVGVGLGEKALEDASIHWSLVPSHIADIRDNDQFINVTAGTTPGFYDDAIRVSIGLDGDDGPVIKNTSIDMAIRGPLDSVKIIPRAATVERGGRTLFRAQAFDEHQATLPDVRLRWSVVDPEAGSINSDGLFFAGQTAGTFPGGVEVIATQRQSTPP